MVAAARGEGATWIFHTGNQALSRIVICSLEGISSGVLPFGRVVRISLGRKDRGNKKAFQ